MMQEVIALLDRPSPSAFGMVPFVARDRDGTLRVYGLGSRVRSTLMQTELDDLVRSGSALLVPEPVPREMEIGDRVVGWLGSAFRSEVLRLRAPEPRVPERVWEVEGQGVFWLAEPASVYGLLDQWTREAAAEVFSGTGGAALAELMLWVLPERDETRAAVWHTRAGDSEKRRHLEWYARLDRDVGRPVSESELEARFVRIASEYGKVVSRRRDMLRQDGPSGPQRRHAPLFGAGRGVAA